MLLKTGAQLSLLFSMLLIIGCARNPSISDLIKSKKHDRDGIYHIAYDKPQKPQAITSELDALGYSIKEAYYWDGLQKKTDKYKFVWFYGPEYENLKGDRKLERSRDKLLAKGDMSSFIKALTEYPQFPIENPQEVGLKHIKSIEDLGLYHEHFGDENMGSTELIAQKMVADVEDLLSYRKIYGVSEYTEARIPGLLKDTNLEEAKLLVENFTDSKYITAIELNHLSKTGNITDFLKEETAQKHFDVDPTFPLESKAATIGLREKMTGKLPSSHSTGRLLASLLDSHIEKKVGFFNDEYDKVEAIVDYAEANKEWIGSNYVRNKEVSLISSINSQRFGAFKSFMPLYKDLDQIMAQWAWRGGYKYGFKLTVVETFKGSLRKEKSSEKKKSALDDIFFEKVDNMVFQDISEEIDLDEYSYLRLSGKYLLTKDSKERLPFHAIFKLDEKNKKYEISELVITDLGVYNTHFDGKDKNKYLYYDKSSGSLKRKG